MLRIIFTTSSNQRLWECVRRRLNFRTDTLSDFQSPKINLFSSTTGVLQKDISVTKSMPFWLERSRYKIRRVTAPVSDFVDSQVYNRTKIFTSAFKFRAKYFHIKL